MANIDHINSEIDKAPVSSGQIIALTLCVLIAVVDGLDFVAIGVVAPLIMSDIGLSAAAFGVVLAATQIGAAIGALSLGRVADRIGRKPVILVSLLLLSLFTFLTTVKPTFASLLPVRFLAGVALGGAIPATIALVTEISPSRIRSTMVALIVAGFPLGAASGSFLGGVIGETLGWQSVFYVGAVLPLVLAAFIVFWLPESPRFLALKDTARRRLVDTLSRLVPRADLAALWSPRLRTQHSAVVPDAEPRSSFRNLFTDGLAASTLMLWTLLFCSGVLSNVMIVWMPTLFTQAGLSLGYAAAVVGALNLGATLGMLLAGRMMDIVGPRLTIGPAFAIAAVATGLLGFVGTLYVSVIIGAVLGFFLGMTTSAGYGLSAQIYPTLIRSTGVGAGAASLRVGTVVAPLVVPLLLGLALPIEWTFAWVAVLPAVAAVIASQFRRSSLIECQA